VDGQHGWAAVGQSASESKNRNLIFLEPTPFDIFWTCKTGKTMKNKKASIILICLGVLFLLNSIFGGYIVLPSYLAGLEAGSSTFKVFPGRI
jgi:hypothetical protein